MELFNDFNQVNIRYILIEQETEEALQPAPLSLNFKDDKKSKEKENKYSVKEIIFNIQIYKVKKQTN